jgi:hypothetical protein
MLIAALDAPVRREPRQSDRAIEYTTITAKTNRITSDTPIETTRTPPSPAPAGGVPSDISMRPAQQRRVWKPMHYRQQHQRTNRITSVTPINTLLSSDNDFGGVCPT